MCRRLQFNDASEPFRAFPYSTELQLYALFALLAKLWGTLRKKKKGKAEIRFPLVDGAEDAFMASRARQASGKTLATKSRLQPRKTRLLQGAPTSAVAGPAALFFARAQCPPERHSSVVLRFLHPTSHVLCVVNVARQPFAGVSCTNYECN